MSENLSWHNELGTIATSLISANDKDQKSNNPSTNRALKEATNGLTIAEIRTVACQLDTEEKRIRTVVKAIQCTRESLKEVVGL